MSDAHARQYYFGAGTETNQGSGTIDSYTCVEEGPSALSTGMPVEPPAPQHGLNAPIAQDKARGSS